MRYQWRWLPFVCLVNLASCYYDNEETLYPDSYNCTAVTDPSFNSDVQPLFDSRCNNCHSGSFPSAGIRLDNYTEVQKYVKDGSLMGSINQTSGFSPMPKNSSKLTSCQIETIQNWINSGAVDN
jgi:hypothetical protein